MLDASKKNKTFIIFPEMAIFKAKSRNMEVFEIQPLYESDSITFSVRMNTTIWNLFSTLLELAITSISWLSRHMSKRGAREQSYSLISVCQFLSIAVDVQDQNSFWECVFVQGIQAN